LTTTEAETAAGVPQPKQMTMKTTTAIQTRTTMRTQMRSATKTTGMVKPPPTTTIHQQPQTKRPGLEPKPKLKSEAR